VAPNIGGKIREILTALENIGGFSKVESRGKFN
jgi:hypothetical protein